MIILQLAIILAFLGFGELIVCLTEVPVPSSIIGMLSLAFALQLKIVRLRWVNSVAEFLTRNIGFFFIPAGISLMQHFNIIASEWLPIVVAAVLSTAIVLSVTGRVHQFIRNTTSRHNNHNDQNHVSVDA